MNVEILTETAQFPEKEYINGIFVAVYNKVLLVWGSEDLPLSADKLVQTAELMEEYKGFGFGFSSIYTNK